jgi:hypothetical protein
MVLYQPNNILFRITSAAAISKFKSIQAHSLGQLNRKELDFDTSAREVVLITYDRFSQWIYRVERICLTATSNKYDTPTLIRALIASFIDEQRITQTVIESHGDIFKNGIDAYVRIIHNYTSRIIKHFFESLCDKKIIEIYAEIVDITSMYLQHILVAMHEFNNNCVTNKKQPFVSIADFCLNITKPELKLIPCFERIKFFAKCSKHTEFLLKFYGSDEHTFDEAFEKLQEMCKQLNITLVKEELLIAHEEK